MATLIAPYGGGLVDLFVGPDEIKDLKAEAAILPSIQISERSVCDLEMLATGAFSPLNRFMGKEDYHSVLEDMRLSSGHIYPIPVTLCVNSSPEIQLDHRIALRNAKNELLAVMVLEEIYEWDRREVAEKVFRTQDVRHPVVSEMHRWGKLQVSGQIQVLKLPRRYDFQELRLTPSETRKKLSKLTHNNVVAFQTRNPLHRVHEELTKKAIQEHDAALLLHPVIGMTKPGDVDYYTRVRTYKILASRYYDEGSLLFSLLPLAMRLAGPREALWHALIRRNYGANYLIVGRDHASPGKNSDGKPFYGPYEAQDLVDEFSEELGVGSVPFTELVYLPDEDRYEEVSKISAETRRISISGTEVRENYLNEGKVLPSWFTRPEVAKILAESHPPRYKQGFCVWFTGLSASGKSTTAEVLENLLMERGRQATVLDGDVVRTNLSKGLGFSKEDRDTNIRRIGFVAAEIVRHGGTVICAAVSPYRVTRNDVRNRVGVDCFVEVFVDTPLEVCEKRDTKGMYARARRGEIVDFTGINDPYEPPEHAEIVLDTLSKTGKENALLIMEYLGKKDFFQEV